MLYFALLLAVLVFSFFYSIYKTFRSNKRRREWLNNRFGKPPSEDFRPNMESVTAYWLYRQDEKKDTSMVDDITWNDLDMDDIFRRVDSCLTSPGEEMLYATLRTLDADPDLVEEAVAFLRKNPEKRMDIQSYLAQMGKMSGSGLCRMFMEAKAYETYKPQIVLACAFLPLVSILLFLVSLPLGLFALIASVITNIVLSFLFSHEMQGRQSTIRYLSSMLWCANKLATMELDAPPRLLQELKEAFTPFRRIRGKLSGVMQEAVRSSEMEAMMTMGRYFLLSEVRSYNRAISVVTGNVAKLRALYEAIGKLDMAISNLSLRKSAPKICQPQFHKEMTIDASEIVHPLLQYGVPNDADITKNTIITGSNASGKSTYIKAIAANAILGQALNVCIAKSFAMPRAVVVSSMAVRDSITRGDSYFIAEIKSIKRIMDIAAERPCLCFVDEILRGTNTIERIAASAAVLMSLNLDNCLCVVASHDIELTKILQGIYQNRHFRETVTPDGITFDYKVQQGPSNTRNAIRLLEVMGFDKGIIARADDMAMAFEEDQKWPLFGEDINQGGGAPS